MPGMITPTFIPACCAPPSPCWPFAEPLAGITLLTTRYDATRLEADDFSRCGIARPRGVAKRQTEFLAGRLCAREALQQVLGIGTVPAVGEDRAPIWPDGAVGSITHGAGWAGAAVASASRWRGLGLDIEALLSPERAARLAGEILTDTEQAALAAVDEAARAWRLTLAFSLKEALFKALYPLVRRRFYFEAAQVTQAQDGVASLRLLSDLDAEWQAGTELHGYYAELDGRLLTLVAVPAAAAPRR